MYNISAVSSHTINTNLSKISIITSNDPDYGTPDFVWINGLGFVANNVNRWSISNVSGGSFKISTSYGGYAINIVAIGE